MWTWRAWLARLGFSFIIVAALLAWHGYQLTEQHAQPWRIYGFYSGAIICLSLGLAGMRERHR